VAVVEEHAERLSKRLSKKQTEMKKTERTIQWEEYQFRSYASNGEAATRCHVDHGLGHWIHATQELHDDLIWKIAKQMLLSFRRANCSAGTVLGHPMISSSSCDGKSQRSGSWRLSKDRLSRTLYVLRSSRVPTGDTEVDVKLPVTTHVLGASDDGGAMF
jgi:hypothetical protein